jgi:RNA polymerase sigma factor (sigma-70 family)
MRRSPERAAGQQSSAARDAAGAHRAGAARDSTARDRTDRDKTHGAILAVWRIEQPRLITGLARMLRDVPLAEDLTQEALVAALERWPRDGVPERPGAWLFAAARRRALDHLRRRAMLARKHEEVAREREAEQFDMPDPDAALDDDIGDELLRLIFTACHPMLSREARAALALRMLCGLTTREIARAFLVPEATVSQRIVRAKRTLAESGLSYETPHGAELKARLTSVLEVVYLIFNEGYTAARGDDWMRPQLCSEALRLARVLTSIAPGEPEAHGLLALMELNASRAAARIDGEGAPILLTEQDRARWDQLQIRRGLAALARAKALGGAGGFYALQAAIVACHAKAASVEETDWRRIAALYGELVRLAPSPVAELNRAVAVGMAEGPAAGLAVAERLTGEPALARYHLLPGVRGDLLSRLGRHEEARAAFEAAAALAGNARERDLMKRRAAEAGSRCAPSSPPDGAAFEGTTSSG